LVIEDEKDLSDRMAVSLGSQYYSRSVPMTESTGGLMLPVKTFIRSG
jgi:hypothetical protein